MQAVILCGGKGTRMESSIPKALVQTRRKTIIQHQIDYLLPKVNKIVLALGFQGQEVEDFVKLNYPSEPIAFSHEQEPLGTGGALKKALLYIDSPDVLVLNGDDFTNINPDDLMRYGEQVLCTAKPRSPFGLVEEHEGYAKFVEKPILDLQVSCGWYLFRKNEIQHHLPEKGSLEYDVFPKIKLKVHKHEGFWHTINNKKQQEEFDEMTDIPGNF